MKDKIKQFLTRYREETNLIKECNSKTPLHQKVSLFVSILCIILMVFVLLSGIPSSAEDSTNSYTLDGVWRIKETPDINLFTDGALYDLGYMTSGSNYHNFSFYSYGDFVGITAVPSDPTGLTLPYEYVHVYNVNDGWVNQQYRYVTFDNSVVSEDIYNWINSNADYLCDHSYLAISGSYLLNEVPDWSLLFDSNYYHSVFYSSLPPENQIVYPAFQFRSNDYAFYGLVGQLKNAAFSPTGTRVYDLVNNKWIDDSYRFVSIELILDDPLFYDWLLNNSIFISEYTTLTFSGTWIFNDIVNIYSLTDGLFDQLCYVTSGTGNFNFSSSGTPYLGIYPYAPEDLPSDLGYESVPVYSVSNGWADFSYRVVTFDSNSLVPMEYERLVYENAEHVDYDIPSDDFITVFFHNNWYWSDVRLYYWTSSGSLDWPGIPMTPVNDNVSTVYAAFIPSNVSGIVISGLKDDGSGTRDQTPDITSGIKDGAGWEMIWNGINATIPYSYPGYTADSDSGDSGSGDSGSGDSGSDTGDAVYDAGYNAGYVEGRSDGFSEGHALGYDQGYTKGYSDAKNFFESSDLIGSFLTDLFSMPQKALSQIVFYDSGGVVISLWSIISTITVMLWFIKLLGRG